LSKDEVQALSWYRKAADAGDAEGMNRLGLMYEHGRGGLTADKKLAVGWYRKAAAAGDPHAAAALERLQQQN
jgi:TPR repeat protein